MAMVLDAFASYLRNMLTEMAKEEVRMVLGVSGEIQKMGVKLDDLKNVLADADRRNITDQSVQRWVRELKGAMYDATDILDLCQLKAMERRESMCGAGDAPGCIQPLLCGSALEEKLLELFAPLFFSLRNPFFAHDIGSRVKAVSKRLGGIKERSAEFSFVNLGSYEERSSRGRHDARLSSRRETSGEIDLSGIVGEKIEEDTRELVERLTAVSDGDGEDKKMMAMAIVGVGGIGKTTLAKKVFNDEAIQREFDKKLWLSVKQDYRETDLLKAAITQAGGRDHRAAGDNKAALEPILKEALKAKKVLLVMDDVWSEQAWEGVLRTPLRNTVAPGSRVLVTTRHDTVARGMKAMEPFHHVDKLGDEDAWLLLKKQVVSGEKDEHEVDMLKDIGLEIISKCEGLPLAVKVLGGLLCQREKRQGDWEMVLKDSIWSVSEMPVELNNAIYLSYEDLNPYLKQCFLHYSLLPKNTVFFNDTIVSMWISEGFLHGNSDKLEEIGEKYYKELISRNLIEPDVTYAGEWVSNMHDVVRSFAQFVARDEALVAHNKETNVLSKLHTEKFLRLSIQTEGLQSDEFEWRSLKEQKSLRTLISVGHIKINPGDSLSTFTSLRTLHLESAKCADLVESLHQLKHLRYLSLNETDISRLPDNIDEIKFLQYISLEGCDSLEKLPNSIAKLEQLRHLNLDEASIFRGFRGLTNLRTLHGFLAHTDGDWCSLEELGPLSQLRLLELNCLEKVPSASSVAEARLGEKEHLTDLSLCCTSRMGQDGSDNEEEEGGSEEEEGVSEEEEGVSDDITKEDESATKEEESVSEEEQKKIEEVFDELCPPPCLEYLAFSGYFGRRLPKWMMSSTEASVPLKNLRILMMENLACCTQLPDGLCHLPCLHYIQIDGAPAIERIGSEFQRSLYHHRHSHHLSSQASAAFPRLQQMNLIGMVEWKEWEWELEEPNAQAMPVLEELSIDGCKLRRLPPGLSFSARALKKLTICRVEKLDSLENLVSIVELEVDENPDLERVTNLPRLQRLGISDCPKMKILEGVPALQRIELQDYDMETLPGYMKDVKPRHLMLDCSLALLTCIAAGESDLEWDKFNHIQHVKAYADDGDNEREWYVLYTKRDLSCNLDTNIVITSSGSAAVEEEGGIQIKQ